METVVDRFLRYVSFDTQSAEEKETVPSTEKQWALARQLAKEMEEMGVSRVRVSEYGYVYGMIPASGGNPMEKLPAMGFIAHMDTSPALSGTNVKPRLVERYDGGRIVLHEEKGIGMGPEQFPALTECIGKDLIVTDGTTLLGADDKAGVAEIMAMAQEILTHPEVPHGRICIGFTPDEEVGRGADFFDVEGFGAQVAYTVDGGALGSLEYENFNAASGKVFLHGTGIHPGDAKGRMKNAVLMGMEFQNLLPAAENPMYTEGYEGFFHLDQFSGNVEEARMDYLIRDHDRELFEKKKRIFLAAADFLKEKYGETAVEASVTDSYYNMKEKVESHLYLIDLAKDAMTAAGVTPKVMPIRGGTDGARLSFMGLPCPNLCTGGYHFHGKYEFIPVQSMETMVEILVGIVRGAVTGSQAVSHDVGDSSC